jgi:hypothetical protein
VNYYYFMPKDPFRHAEVESSSKQTVKGIDLGDGMLLTLDDKLVATTKGSTVHLTIHFGPKSKILDIHLTRRTQSGLTEHEKLFEIPHDKLEILGNELVLPATHRLLRAFRRLRPGWLARNGIGVILGMFPPKEADLRSLFTVRKRRLVPSPDKIEQNIRAPEFYENLYNLPDYEGFTLVGWRKRRSKPEIIGVGLKLTDIFGNPRLMWLTRQRIDEAVEEIGKLLEAAAKKYGTFQKPLRWQWKVGGNVNG